MTDTSQAVVKNGDAQLADRPSGSRDDADPIESDNDRGIVVRASDMKSELLRKKKKKSRNKTRSAGKRGLDKPTGFEEYHADAPLTPEQFAESREAFNPDFPFVDRVLKAIQRFERTRKLSSERRDIFYKYLAYGGVDVGPNMFVGAQNTEDMDKDDITTSMAQANISDDTKQNLLDPKHEQAEDTELVNESSKLYSADFKAKYTVDFEGIMRAFLSRRAPNIYCMDTKAAISLVTTTLERFMDYLLLHDACPEYKTEILATRNLCRSAAIELWECSELQRKLPGDFNRACSFLFDETKSYLHRPATDSTPVESSDWNTTTTTTEKTPNLDPERATQIVGFAIAGAASEPVYESYLSLTTGDNAGRGFEITRTVPDHGFEITDITPPTRECEDFYRQNTRNLHAVGTVTAKFFHNPDAPPEDLSAEEKAQMSTSTSTSTSACASSMSTYANTLPEGTTLTFFVEAEDVLPLLRVGTRVEATLYQLNCGVWFFDDTLRVLPTFDLWVENELTVGWKEPRWIEGAGAVDYAAMEEREREREQELSKNMTSPASPPLP